jgi:hypothetical protein
LLQRRSTACSYRAAKAGAVGRLISGVVNDLQTPLEAISSMADSALSNARIAAGHEVLVSHPKPARRGDRHGLVSFVQPEQAQASRSS